MRVLADESVDLLAHEGKRRQILHHLVEIMGTIVVDERLALF